MSSHYDVLGVARSADADEVKRAYRRLARRHHPDKAAEGEAREKANARFIRIQAAYEVLSCADKRAEYDRDRAGGGGGGGGAAFPFTFRGTRRAKPSTADVYATFFQSNLFRAYKEATAQAAPPQPQPQKKRARKNATAASSPPTTGDAERDEFVQRFEMLAATAELEPRLAAAVRAEATKTYEFLKALDASAVAAVSGAPLPPRMPPRNAAFFAHWLNPTKARTGDVVTRATGQGRRRRFALFERGAATFGKLRGVGDIVELFGADLCGMYAVGRRRASGPFRLYQCCHLIEVPAVYRLRADYDFEAPTDAESFKAADELIVLHAPPPKAAHIGTWWWAVKPDRGDVEQAIIEVPSNYLDGNYMRGLRPPPRRTNVI